MFKYELRKSLCLIALAVIISGCGGNWKTTVHVIGDRTFAALEQASNTADKMVVDKLMTAAQRQEFARDVMVPATTALEGAIQSTLTWKEGDPIPENIAKLIGVLTKAVDSTSKTFGSGTQLHDAIILVRNRANGLLAQVQ